MKFKHLEDLRDIHKGEEIWILGRGPSLDDFPEDFFDDKVSIAASYAFLAFPNCTYYHSLHAEPAEYVFRNWPDKFSKCILGCIRNPPPGDKQRRNKFENYGEVPTYARVRGSTNNSYKELKDAIERIISKETCELFNSTTTLRTAIQVAIILGAMKITLVGCELKISRGLLHAKSTWIGVKPEVRLFKRRAKWSTERFFPGCRKGLSWLVEICKPHNIEIVRYYYKTGYEQIPGGS